VLIYEPAAVASPSGGHGRLADTARRLPRRSGAWLTKIACDRSLSKMAFRRLWSAIGHVRKLTTLEPVDGFDMLPRCGGPRYVDAARGAALCTGAPTGPGESAHSRSPLQRDLKLNPVGYPVVEHPIDRGGASKPCAVSRGGDGDRVASIRTRGDRRRLSTGNGGTVTSNDMTHARTSSSVHTPPNDGICLFVLSSRSSIRYPPQRLIIASTTTMN